MNLITHGGNKIQRQLAKEVVFYASDFLLTKKVLPNLTVDIRLGRPAGLFGSCVWNDSNIRPREFIIEIHKDLDEVTFIETLCHEVVHLKQYVRSQMKERYNYGHRILWYDVDCTELPYEDQPWELEAELLEHEMGLSFLTYKYGYAL